MEEDWFVTLSTGSVLTCYTDGFCLGNPGPGGWGVAIEKRGSFVEFSGGEQNTTNNRMELKACVRALEIVPARLLPNIKTDSRYVIDGLRKWILNWKKNNWRTSSNQPVKNKDLWERLDSLNIDKFSNSVRFEWVPAHTGIVGNERADSLANGKAHDYKNTL
jgi:ribonuclease HI